MTTNNSSFYIDSTGDVSLLNDVQDLVDQAQTAADNAATSAAEAAASAEEAAASASDALDAANSINADLVNYARKDQANTFVAANTFSSTVTLNGTNTVGGATTFNGTATFTSTTALPAATTYAGTNVQTLLNAKLDANLKGANNGVAELDSTGKLKVSQLPASVFTYLGGWNASTNNPPLANGGGDAGDTYKVTVGGTVNFGAGNITFVAGDFVIYAGGVYTKDTDTGNVLTVNGYTGAVVLVTDDIAEDGSPTNKWFTDARARTALGATTANNVPRLVTLSGVAADSVSLGAFDGTTIRATPTIKEALQDLETAVEAASTGISGLDTDDVAEGSNLYYTNARARAALGNGTGGTGNAGVVTNDTVPMLVELTGRPVDSITLGTFTGTTIADSRTIKDALQDLETAHETASTKVTNLVSLTGMAANSATFGTGAFTGTTIPDSSTIKSALQSLETAIETTSTVTVTGATSTPSSSEHKNKLVLMTNSGASTYTVGIGTLAIGESTEVSRMTATGTLSIVANAVKFLPPKSLGQSTGTIVVLDNYRSVMITRIADSGGYQQYFIRGAFEL